MVQDDKAIYPSPMDLLDRGRQLDRVHTSDDPTAFEQAAGLTEQITGPLEENNVIFVEKSGELPLQQPVVDPLADQRQADEARGKTCNVVMTAQLGLNRAQEVIRAVNDQANAQRFSRHHRLELRVASCLSTTKTTSANTGATARPTAARGDGGAGASAGNAAGQSDATAVGAGLFFDVAGVKLALTSAADAGKGSGTGTAGSSGAERRAVAYQIYSYWPRLSGS